MRVYAASASASVTRTLQAIITLSGHTSSSADDAELVIEDHLHTVDTTLPTCPRISLGASTQSDALTTPLRPQQLLRLLATRKANATQALAAGWQLDAQTRSLTHSTHDAVPLTEKEAALLAHLLQHPTGIGRDALLTKIWGVRNDVDTHTLETHLYRLRQKFGDMTPPPCDIISENGQYRILCD